MEYPDETHILEVITSMVDAWNRNDARAFAGMFATDADFINMQGTLVHGRHNIQKMHATAFRTALQQSRLLVDETRICSLTSKVIQVDVWWHSSEPLDGAGNPTPETRGLLMLILMPEQDQWVIKILHNIDLTPALSDVPTTLL